MLKKCLIKWNVIQPQNHKPLWSSQSWVPCISNHLSVLPLSSRCLYFKVVQNLIPFHNKIISPKNKSHIRRQKTEVVLKMYTSCLTQNLHQYIWQISPYMMKSPTNNGYIDDPNIKELDLHMAPPWYLCSQSSYRLRWTDCPLFPLSAVNRNFTYNIYKTVIHLYVS